MKGDFQIASLWAANMNGDPNFFESPFQKSAVKLSLRLGVLIVHLGALGLQGLELLL